MNRFAAAVALLAIPVLLSLIVTAQSNMILKGTTTPPTSGTCAESTAWLARIPTVGATYRSASNNWICGLVTAGTWAKLGAFWVPGTQDATTANLNLKSSSFTLTPNGSPNFSANNGYLGVEGSTTVFLDTGYNPNAVGGSPYTLNRASIGVWIVSTNAQSAGNSMGALETSSGAGTGITPRFTDDNAYASINATGGATGFGIANSTGFWVASRTDADQFTYRNGAQVGTGSTFPAISIPNFPLFILARNNNGSGAAGGTPYRVAAAFIAQDLTAGDVSTFNTLGCAYLTAIGSAGAC